MFDATCLHVKDKKSKTILKTWQMRLVRTITTFISRCNRFFLGAIDVAQKYKNTKFFTIPYIELNSSTY